MTNNFNDLSDKARSVFSDEQLKQLEQIDYSKAIENLNKAIEELCAFYTDINVAIDNIIDSNIKGYISDEETIKAIKELEEDIKNKKGE